MHTGTPSFHGEGDRQQTRENLNQLDTFIPDGGEITDNALNSPHVVNGIPNFLNKIDRNAPDLIQKAQAKNGKSSYAVTPFNGMRCLANNDNRGFDKNLISLGVAFEGDPKFQDISNYLINAVNKDLALKQVEAINDNQDLKNAIKAKSMVIKPHSILDSENQNLKLVSFMIAVDFAYNNEKGAIKKDFPDIKIGKVNIHCASGKDRTSISLTDATNKAVSEKLKLSKEQSRNNLETQMKGGHTQELASLNGGTPGCHGVKSDSKTALSKDNPLGKLIEDTAGFNKIKTQKTFGDKAKNFFKNLAIAIAVVITLPITLTAVIVSKKLTSCAPDKSTVKIAKANSITKAITNEPKIEIDVDKTRKQEKNKMINEAEEKLNTVSHTDKALESRKHSNSREITG